VNSYWYNDSTLCCHVFYICTSMGLEPEQYIMLFKFVVFSTGKFRREFKRTFLQCRCLYNITSSPSQTGHFGNHVSTASEFPMTSTFTPGSIRGGCYLPSSNTSSIRHQGRRHLSNGEKSSSSRLLVPSSGSSVDYGSKHGRSPRLTLSVDGVPAVRAFP